MDCHQKKLQRNDKNHWSQIGVLVLGAIVALFSFACDESPLPDFDESLEKIQSPFQVISTSPEPEATDIDLYIPIETIFNTSIDSSSINETTFIVRQDTTSIPGSFTYSDSSVTFDPSVELLRNTTIYITITSDIRDAEGNRMGQDYDWSFTTREATAYEGMPPMVISSEPSPGASDVSASKKIYAHFNKTLKPSTINSNTFLLRGNNLSVSGSVSYKDSTATFRPSANLQDGTVYTATITTAVEDRYGNSPETNYNWNFSTREVDRTPPHIVSTHPDDDDDDIPVDIRIKATFSEEMDPNTVTNKTFRIYYERGFGRYHRQIPGSVSFSGNTATFTPNSNLRDERDYIAIISSSVTDLAGNELGETYQWDFETDDD